MPGKAVSASPFATTCATLTLAPNDGQDTFTLHVSTHGPQVRFGYRHEDDLWFGRLPSPSGFAAAQDLDGRAREYGVLEPDVRLGDLYLYGFYFGMLVERSCGDPLCQGLGKSHGRSLDDVARRAMDLAVVNGLRKVVGGPGGSQVEVQFDAHDERLSELVLRLQCSVTAVEDHVRKKYAILAHRVFSLPSIRISMPERKDRYARDTISEKG